jgi:hypothetical protein
MTTYTVYRQNWLESERGWGIRPDGYSLHLSRLDRDVYVRQYWDRMPNQVPDEYSRCAVEVDEATYAAIAASQHGIRRYR